MDESMDADKIKQSGWRQGSIVNAELVDQLTKLGKLPAPLCRTFDRLKQTGVHAPCVALTNGLVTFYL